MRATTALIVIVLTGIAVADRAAAQESSVATAGKTSLSFSGQWTTDFGLMRLQQVGQKVTGVYDLGTITGTVEGRVLRFRYQESAAAGQGKFVLAYDGASFAGTWRVDGGIVDFQWKGKRHEQGFEGLWDTSYGRMRLVRDEQEIHGSYEYPSGEASIQGQIKGQRFIFRYKDEQAGSGWFELSDDRMEIAGQWRPDGEKEWKLWKGVRKVAEPGAVWLTILEANWETRIDEPQYAFASMLEQYFTMAEARHVEVRKRAFHDEADLRRFCGKVKYLPGPVVLLISTHGSPNGITVFGETIQAKALAESLSAAGNIKLLHLSGCAMMSGDFPTQVQSSLVGPKFPISGYKTMVAWDASALSDFTFLSMLLIRRMDPQTAINQAILASPYLGERRVKGLAFRPLGLSLLPVKKTESGSQE